MNDHITEHGQKEKFCPECYDFHPGEVTTHEKHGVTAWSCCKCGYTDDLYEVPHDPSEVEE